jgi:hypothetical protein
MLSKKMSVGSVALFGCLVASGLLAMHYVFEMNTALIRMGWLLVIAVLGATYQTLRESRMAHYIKLVVLTIGIMGSAVWLWIEFAR